MNFENKTSKQNPFFRSHLARQTRILLALSSDLFLLNKKRNTRVFPFERKKYDTVCSVQEEISATCEFSESETPACDQLSRC